MPAVCDRVMNKEIIELLQQGTTLITPTNRLSRHLQSHYAAVQIEEGRIAWQSADILPWTAWLQRSWEAISMQEDPPPCLLNAHQQQAVWQQIIAASPYAPRLLQDAATARQAIAAWKLLQQWQLRELPEGVYLNEDARVFTSWAAAYEKRCATENWVDEARLADVYREDVRKYHALPGKSIALLGFHELTPQQESLLACLEELGCRIIHLKLERRNAVLRQAGLADTRRELRAAAHWARQLLEQSPKPGAATSIGIVVPDLQACRHIVEAEFDDVLAPAAILSAADSEQHPYSISLGRALGEYPLIDTALTLLGLLHQPAMIDAISLLLRSPFIKAAAIEAQGRAQLDAALREHGEPRLSLHTILYIATNKRTPTQRCRGLIDSLSALRELMQALPAKQTPLAWADSFSKVLNIFSWPGERALNSAEYQIVAAWQEVLARFVSLELVLPRLGRGAALAQLRRLVTGFSFQPETAEAPIQILGLAGAAEMQFEHLWLLGLHEESWPQAALPNPFIPLSLQRAQRMPRASAEIELDYARTMTEALLNSSPDVVLSYPQNKKERALRPSPLLRPYLENAAQLSLRQEVSYAERILHSRKMEVLEDNSAPVIRPGDALRGGTSLFKDQSACAFRAFARHRLHAGALPEVDIGLDARARGALVHALMQLFWSRVGTQQSLLAMSEAQLDALIHNCAKQVVHGRRGGHRHSYSARFVELEIARLEGLLREWLQQERSRSAFVVRACEAEQLLKVEGIEVRTRIDRIDELEDGRQLIIDYKTGATSINDWFGERPDDPQLPLYAISSEADIAALAFARIRRGEMAYVGLAEEGAVFPKTKAYSDAPHKDAAETWGALLLHWKEVLSALGIAFRAGDAAVRPKDMKTWQTCRYCDLHAFCRIHEKRANSETGAD